MVSTNFDEKFLKAVGFGKDEALWITQYDSWPVTGGFRSEWTLVGREGVRCPSCGKHRSFYKCSDVEKHGGVFAGKDVWHNVVLNCHSPSCSRCWKYGWAVREGHSIEDRFLTAEKVLGFPCGDVEHISASVPKKDYSLPYDVLCKKGISALKDSGVPSGCTLFHGHRKNYDTRELEWRPHFHSLAYVQGGYRCRDCEFIRHTRQRVYCGREDFCDGFEQRTRRAHVADGWIVSLAKNENGVVEKRKNIYGTAWYQLEHASKKVGAKRFQIVKWFGALGNRKFKTVHRPMEHLCCVCGGHMGLSYPVGVEPIVANRGEKGFLKNFLTEHVEGER